MDLIAATAPVILLKSDPNPWNRWFLGPGVLAIWQMTRENNGTSLPCPFKLCASFHSHLWKQTYSLKTLDSSQNRRFNGPCDLEIWQMPRNIGHLFYTPSNIVHHFVVIRELQLELLSGKAQFVSKLAIFCLLWPWNLMHDYENQYGTPLHHFKLCTSFCSHLWIKTGVTVLKRSNWGKLCFDICDLDLWPLTFCMDFAFVNDNNSWKLHEVSMMGT